MAASPSGGARDVGTLGLAPSTVAQLQAAGYRTAGDLHGVGPMILANDTGLSPQDALAVLKRCRGDSGGPNSNPTVKPSGVSVLELLQLERQRSPVITFVDELDKLLGGGIPLGKITEFCGVPGIGKTQLGIQLAVDAQLPKMFGGVDGQAIYIDTEGSFVPDRVVDMASALVEHLVGLVESSGDETAVENLRNSCTVDGILSRIHYFRVHSYVEQIALINLLPSILDTIPDVKLVVMDSVTFHFRQAFDNMAQRTRLLNGMAQSLMEIASSRGIAVVLMNQVTTKFTSTASHLAPALGESWGHMATNRLILYWNKGRRYAHLYKSPTVQEGTVEYAIFAEGVRHPAHRSSKRSRSADEDDDLPDPDDQSSVHASAHRRLE